MWTIVFSRVNLFRRWAPIWFVARQSLPQESFFSQKSCQLRSDIILICFLLKKILKNELFGYFKSFLDSENFKTEFSIYSVSLLLVWTTPTGEMKLQRKLSLVLVPKFPMSYFRKSRFFSIFHPILSLVLE